MLHFITEIIAVQPCEVVCRFNNGEVRHVNLQPLLAKYAGATSGPFAQLRDGEYFKMVKLDSYGALCWDNGVDLPGCALPIEYSGETASCRIKTVRRQSL
jgi:hypothetical protein